MDKRFKPLSLHEQVALRQKAVEDTLENQQWSLGEVVRHIRNTLRLTVPELAQLAKVSKKTIVNIESGSSAGTVQTMNQLLGVVGLKLGVQQHSASTMQRK